MRGPSTTALVFRVAYRRPSWKSAVWKHKLFNSEQAMLKYVANLTKPVDDDTPEKYRHLQPAEVRCSMATVRWAPFDLDEEVVGITAPIEPEYVKGVSDPWDSPVD